MYDLYQLTHESIPESEQTAHSEFDIFGKIEQSPMIVKLYLIGTPERTGIEISLREAIPDRFALVFDSRLSY